MGFLWRSYSDWRSKQIWTTNRSVYTMFFMEMVVFATQILAFATCFSWFLRVGAVQANTFCANVWNSHEKNQQLEIQKSWIFSEITTISSFLHAKSPNLGRKPPICSPGQAKSSKNRRFAALAKRKIKKKRLCKHVRQNIFRNKVAKGKKRLCKHVRQNIFRNKVAKGKNGFSGVRVVCGGCDFN